MRLARLTIVFVSLLILGLPTISCAETLDGDSITKFYGEMAQTVQDYNKTQDILETRLDDNFKLALTTAQLVGTTTHPTTYNIMDKLDTIGFVMNEFTSLSLQSYEQSIENITYSADKKTADVKHNSIAIGLMTIPSEVSSTGTSLTRYIDQQSCMDKLSLMNDTIKMLQSTCNQQFTLKK